MNKNLRYFDGDFGLASLSVFAKFKLTTNWSLSAQGLSQYIAKFYFYVSFSVVLREFRAYNYLTLRFPASS